MDKIEENIPLFDWLNDYLRKHDHFIPNYNPLTCIIERQAKL